MTTAEAAMTNLADLSKLSKQINAQSNEVNKILLDLEKKILEMNLGVEAWVYGAPLSKNEFIIEKESNRSEDPIEVHYSDDEVLGFGRIGDRHALLVRTVRYVDADNVPGKPDWDYVSEEAPRPLLQASRELRVTALERIEPMLEALVKESRRVIDAIEKGRKIVENL